MGRKIIKRSQTPELKLTDVKWLYDVVNDCVESGADGFSFFMPFDFKTGEGVELDVHIRKKIITERDFLNGK